MSAARFVTYQAIGAAVSLAIWLWSGHQVYLFMAGIAVGAGIVGACIGMEERSERLAAQRRERIG